MSNLSDFKGLHLAGGYLHLGWIVCFLILLGSVYFVKEFQSRQNEVFQKQIRDVTAEIESLRSRFNEEESARAKFESKISLKAESRDSKILRLDQQVAALEALVKKPTKKTPNKKK